MINSVNFYPNSVNFLGNSVNFFCQFIAKVYRVYRVYTKNERYICEYGLCV